MLGKRLPKPKDKAEWLEQRRQGITGTDIAGLMGISNYKSPMSIYLDKVNPPPPEESSVPMRLGNMLEEPIAKFWCEENKGYVVRSINTTIVHPEFSFVRCNIDRHIVKPVEELLECKLVGMGKTGEWKEDKLPDEYFLQVQWQMHTTGLKRCHIAAIVGGTKFEQRVVEYNEKLCAELHKLAHDFWHKHVLACNPPAIDGSDATTDAINRLYGSNSSAAAREAAIRFLGSGNIHLPIEADQIIRQYAENSATIKELSDHKDALVETFIANYNAQNERLLGIIGEKNAIANQLRLMCGQFEEATTPGGLKVTWKTQTSKRIDTTRLKAEMGEEFVAAYQNETSSRVLRVPKPK